MFNNNLVHNRILYGHIISLNTFFIFLIGVFCYRYNTGNWMNLCIRLITMQRFNSVRCEYTIQTNTPKTWSMRPFNSTQAKDVSDSIQFAATVAAAAAAAASQLARLAAGAPLPPLLPQLWYSIHSCSLPSIIYHLIFDLMWFVINHSTFILYLRRRFNSNRQPNSSRGRERCGH